MSERLPLGGLLCLAATAFVAFSTEILPAGLLPLIGPDLGVTEAQVGFFTSVFAGAALVIALPLAIAFRRISRRTILFSALGGFALSNMIMAISTVYSVSLVARLLAGASAGLCWAVVMGYGARISPVAKHGRAISFVSAGGTVALALGLPVGTALGNLIGWRPMFAIFSLLALLLIVWSLLILPPIPEEQTVVPHTPLRELFRIPGLFAVLTVILLFMVADSALYTYIAPFAQLSGFTSETLSSLLFVFGLAALVGIWITGIVIDKHLRRMLMIVLSVLLVVIAAMGIMPSVVSVIIVGMALWGVVFGSFPALVQTAYLRLVPINDAEVGSALGVTVFNGGVAIGSFIGGLAIDSVGVMVLPWIFFAVLAASAVVALGAKRGITNRHA